MLSFKTLAILATIALGAVARPADMAARDEAPATTPSTEKITFAMAAPGLEAGVQCGPNKCGAGLVCCNESCGTGTEVSRWTKVMASTSLRSRAASPHFRTLSEPSNVIRLGIWIAIAK
ncbi:hypothetical protein HYQ46_007488 [Verticillium longisporum]|nr:hypothetical protein HYQ46_007488 [Verticillium longisporum]